MSSPGAPRLAAARPVDTGRRRPRRARLVGAALLALPVLELALLITVGRAIGVLPTLGLLLAGAVAGTVVLRRVTAPVGPGRGTPAETALLVPAGLLLVVPGLLSDVVGLVLLVPAVRRALAARAGEAILRRLDRRTIRVVPGEVVGSPGSPVDVHVTEIRTPVAGAHRPGGAPTEPGSHRALPGPERPDR